jgi:hypothetical protein
VTTPRPGHRGGRRARGARLATLLAAASALALAVAGALAGAATLALRTRALGARTHALETENAWLRARLAAVDARVRQLEREVDLGASVVPADSEPGPAFDPARPPPPRARGAGAGR